MQVAWLKLWRSYFCSSQMNQETCIDESQNKCFNSLRLKCVHALQVWACVPSFPCSLVHACGRQNCCDTQVRNSFDHCVTSAGIPSPLPPPPKGHSSGRSWKTNWIRPRAMTIGIKEPTPTYSFPNKTDRLLILGGSQHWCVFNLVTPKNMRFSLRVPFKYQKKGTQHNQTHVDPCLDDIGSKPAFLRRPCEKHP